MEKVFKSPSLRPKKDGRKKIYLVAYTGHGCQATPQAYTHAITDDTEKASVYNIERKMIEIGQHPECAVFGVLGCCRNTVMMDNAPEIPSKAFRGAIVFGARRGDTQLSHSTLA